MKEPVRVAVTGAAGQIAYSLLFRIASGEMLGPDQPVVMQLLEITPALEALENVLLGLTREELELFRTAPLVGLAMDPRLEHPRRGDFLVRNVLGIERSHIGGE